MTNPDRPFRVYSNTLGCEVLVVPDGYRGPVTNPDRLVVYSEAEVAQLARDGVTSSAPAALDLSGLALVHAIKDVFGGRLIIEASEPSFTLDEIRDPPAAPEPEPVPEPDPPAPEPEPPVPEPIAPVVVEPVAPVTVTAGKKKTKKDTAPNLFDF